MSRTRHHSRKHWQGIKSYLWDKDGWCNNEPRWWRKLMKHRKRRAEWLRCYARIKNGCDLDNQVYPMDKKPWRYYW